MNTSQHKRLLLTRAGINVGQQFQMWPQPVEVGWVSSPLQSNRQLLDTLSKRSRGLQLQGNRKNKEEKKYEHLPKMLFSLRKYISI